MSSSSVPPAGRPAPSEPRRPCRPSTADVPPFRYTAALADRIETAWQDRWEREGTFNAPNPAGPLGEGFDAVAVRPHSVRPGHVPVPVRRGPARRPPAGLHRHRRLRPLPADDAATTCCTRWASTRSGCRPSSTRCRPASTRRSRPTRNIDDLPRQLRRLGLGHDQRRAFATTDPRYYRWTQWIFLQIFNSWYDTEARPGPPDRRADRRARRARAGTRAPTRSASRGRSCPSVERRQVVDDHRLAYLAESPVNWCPGLGTVLANEEVTADGRSERGNFPVLQAAGASG